MLLGYVVLSVGEVWRVRERVELEASAIYSRLATSLEAAGLPNNIVAIAEQAAKEEAEHAVLCRAIVDDRDPGLAPLSPNVRIELGPRMLHPKKRALYEVVALSCVTETFSVALLQEMKTSASDTRVANTVHRIMKDEIDHSRLGWASLAAQAKRDNLGWLSPYLAKMIQGAIAGEIVASDETQRETTAFGILAHADVRAVCTRALEEIIYPGFEHFGISTELARLEMRGEVNLAGATRGHPSQ